MAIVVKSGGNPAPALVGAYGAGMGKRRAEDERQQAQLAAAAEEQRRRIEAQKQEFALSREFTLGRDEASQERSLETMQTAADLREGAAEADQLRRREDVEWGYTTQQRQEFDTLSRSYDEAVNSGQFTPDELKEIKRQVIQKQSGIKELPKLKTPSPHPEGQDVGQVWTDPKSGVTFTRDKDGIPKKLADSPEIKNAESRNKDMESALKQATEELNNAASDKGGSPPTTEAKLKRAEEIFNEMQEFRNRLNGTEKPAAGAEPPIPDAENPFATVTPDAKDAGQVVTKMLKNGQKVRVRRLPNGKWEQVN